MSQTRGMLKPLREKWEGGASEQNGLTSPAAKQESCKEDADDDAKDCELKGAEATKYGAAVASANFLSADRPDIQFAVKGVSTRMAKPQHSDWATLARLARYLVLKPKTVTRYPRQDDIGDVLVYADSDWAGCSSLSL